MDGQTNSPVMFDPSADGFMEDPYPHYAELRRSVPVHEHPSGFWMLSRYADVDALLRSGLSVEKPRPTAPVRSGPSRLKGLALIDRDPPSHTRLRKLVAQAFTARAAGSVEPLVRDVVDDALAEVARDGGGDLVELVAFPLPFTVITRILGMPPLDTARLRTLTRLVVRLGETGSGPEDKAAVAQADAEMVEIVGEAVSHKRRQRGDDLLTALIDAEEDGDRLSHDELVAQVTMLYVAGYETTVNLISGGALVLLRNPEQLRLLRSNPGLAPNAVEEILRHDPPVQMNRRFTVEPYRVGDREIPAGTMVLANLASANRDEDFWGADAEQLRLDRPEARRHLSFGGGAHYCLGGSLARVQGRIAIAELAGRFPGLEQDGDVVWNGMFGLRGVARLPVRV